jgi:hypothetical protein
LGVNGFSTAENGVYQLDTAGWVAIQMTARSQKLTYFGDIEKAKKE